MARVFLDECVDRRLAAHLPNHVVSSSFSRRWQGLSDAAVLGRCAGEIDAFVTIDSNLRHQQAVATLTFGLVVVRAGMGRLTDLLSVLDEVDAAISTIEPGQAIEVGPSD